MLQSANEKYKDKYLKSKVANEKKAKKDSESSVKKTEAFKEINELIKVHR